MSTNTLKQETADKDVRLSKNPQLNVMEGLIRKAATPFFHAFNDIDKKLVTKEGGGDLAVEAQEKLLTYFEKELAYASKGKECEILLQGKGDIPTNKTCWTVNVSGSLVNLAHARSDVTISMAYYVNAEIQCGLVFYPITNEFYVAEKNNGAMSYTSRLRIAGRTLLENSLVGIFSPVSAGKDEDKFIKTFSALRNEKCHTRISGNFVNDVLQFCSGKLNAYVGMNLNAHDVALGELFARESGGYTCEINGTKVELGSQSFVCANHKLQGRLLKAIA